ncbi:MAG: hypothetical protein MZV70_64465 [Desulfobacterales bacterium]|nr:hypothetical protein [Desulfobacterales bacterium]
MSDTAPATQESAPSKTRQDRPDGPPVDHPRTAGVHLHHGGHPQVRRLSPAGTEDTHVFHEHRLWDCVRDRRTGPGSRGRHPALPGPQAQRAPDRSESRRRTAHGLSVSRYGPAAANRLNIGGRPEWYR